MRNSLNACHIAIPAHDLAAAEHFYNELLGCPIARRYTDRVTFDFFGDQLVCHHSPDQPVVETGLYPRHFGLTFHSHADFEALLRLIALRKVPVFQPLRLRFEGTVEEHSTVVLSDPTGNLLEFKHYVDARMMY